MESGLFKGLRRKKTKKIFLLAARLPRLCANRLKRPLAPVVPRPGVSTAGGLGIGKRVALISDVTKKLSIGLSAADDMSGGAHDLSGSPALFPRVGCPGRKHQGARMTVFLATLITIDRQFAFDREFAFGRFGAARCRRVGVGGDWDQPRWRPDRTIWSAIPPLGGSGMVELVSLRPEFG